MHRLVSVDGLHYPGCSGCHGQTHFELFLNGVPRLRSFPYQDCSLDGLKPFEAKMCSPGVLKADWGCSIADSQGPPLRTAEAAPKVWKTVQKKQKQHWAVQLTQQWVGSCIEFWTGRLLLGSSIKSIVVAWGPDRFFLHYWLRFPLWRRTTPHCCNLGCNQFVSRYNHVRSCPRWELNFSLARALVSLSFDSRILHDAPQHRTRKHQSRWKQMKADELSSTTSFRCFDFSGWAHHGNSLSDLCRHRW